MSYIRFSFGNKFNSYTEKIANDLKEKIQNTFSQLNLTYDDFFNHIFPSITGFYISSSNIEREIQVVNRENNLPKDTLVNVFFRPKNNNLFNKNLSFMIKGDIEIKKSRSGNNDSQVIVKDFILCDHTDAKPFELEVDAYPDWKNIDSEYISQPYDNVLSLELLAKIPVSVNVSKMTSFLKKWDNYLEFQKEILKLRLSYHKIFEYKYIEVYEIDNNTMNKDLYEKYIYRFDDRYLYVYTSCPDVEDETRKNTIIEITIEVSSIDYATNKNKVEKSIKNILYNEISIIDATGTKSIDAYKKSTDDNIGMMDSVKNIILGKSISGIEYISKSSTNNKLESDKEYLQFACYLPAFYNEDDEFDTDMFDKEIQSKLRAPYYIGNIETGEFALYSRGKEALRKLKCGDTKNPWLAGYIIEPEKYLSSTNIYNESTIDFLQKHKLNNEQKNAIIKALNSSSIFLIWGPPGTGKTQTITELVYQYNLMGKKVLISSQTHLAIDNVLERLPNQMNVLPIRLTSDDNKVEKKYLPENLLDNYYSAVEYQYSQKLRLNKENGDTILNLQNKYDEIKSILDEINKRRAVVEELQKKLQKLQSDHQNTSMSLNQLMGNEKDLINQIKGLKHLQEHKMSIDIQVLDYPNNESLLNGLNVLSKKWNIREYNTIGEILYQYKKIASDKLIDTIQVTCSELDKKMTGTLDVVTNQIMELTIVIKNLEEENSDNYQSLIKRKTEELNKLLKQKKQLTEMSGIDQIDTVDLFFCNSENVNYKEKLKMELDKINQFRDEYDKLVNRYIEKNINKISEFESKLDQLKQEIYRENENIAKIKIEKSKLDEEIQNQINPISTKNKKVEQYYNEFFKNRIDENSIPSLDADKMARIRKLIDDERYKYEVENKTFELLSSVYTDVISHLQNKNDMLKRDKEKFTKDIFLRNANVYGLTCTASPRYAVEKNEFMSKFGFNESLFIDKIDFDVVIVDEVSKANPIELLIPILYGKSIILVGDHRQLPPIFKYRESNFKEIESRSLLCSKENLHQLKKDVESSLFKEVLESLQIVKAENHYAMLVKQYRFHSQINKVVNHFYGNLLQQGSSLQDNDKKHALNITSDDNKFQIISENSHAYWFNSHYSKSRKINYEDELANDETSFHNMAEVNLITSLVNKINETYKKMSLENNEEYSSLSKTNKKPTIGIISLYQSQVKKLRKSLYPNQDTKYDSIDMLKNAISTVDRFQGDERDIIIVSMVRNNKEKRAGEFTSKFERLNVALSRAKSLLIIVGSKEFFENISVDIPDIKTAEIITSKVYDNIIKDCTLVPFPADIL